VELSDEIAASLIARRFPELSPMRLQLLGTGWDNHAYLVNERYVFRLPHRDLAGQLMADECRVLRHLNQSAQPLPIPLLTYVAEPDEYFPYIIAGYPFLPGETADRLTWTDAQRSANARVLGEFLGVLHRTPNSLPNPPTDTIQRADLAYRLPNVLARVQDPPPGFVELFKDLGQTPQHEGSLVWVHGDLYSRHLVVDSDSKVCGVIDWGDSHVGDPALDLAIAWMFLPPSSWSEFMDAYGPIDDATWRRARFRTMTHWTYLSDYARQRQDEPLLQELEFVLANVMAGYCP